MRESNDVGGRPSRVEKNCHPKFHYWNLKEEES